MTGVSIAASAELDLLLVLLNQMQDPSSREVSPVKSRESPIYDLQVRAMGQLEWHLQGLLRPCPFVGTQVVECWAAGVVVVFKMDVSLPESLAALRGAYTFD